MWSMDRIALASALALLLCGPVMAQSKSATKDYPTADRVEFVLECMQKNGGKQEFIYKCSCVIDQIAQKFTYDDYVEASTVARNQTRVEGERGGLFRDPPETKAAAKRYNQVQTEARKRCDVPR
jgi:hypothetical protein